MNYFFTYLFILYIVIFFLFVFFPPRFLLSFSLFLPFLSVTEKGTGNDAGKEKQKKYSLI